MAYVLTGSEDGMIGLYGNKKRADAAAREYVAKGNEIREDEVVVVEPFKGYWTYSSPTSSWATATVEKWEMQ